MGKRSGPATPGPKVKQAGKERRVLHRGHQRDIVFAVCADGSEPAKKFLEDLSPVDRAKFFQLFMWTGEQGELRNEQKFRLKVGVRTCKIGDKTQDIPIAEFKIHGGSGQRILAYRQDKQWILTNGFPKGDKLSNHLDRAGEIIGEDFGNHG